MIYVSTLRQQKLNNFRVALSDSVVQGQLVQLVFLIRVNALLHQKLDQNLGLFD